MHLINMKNDEIDASLIVHQIIWNFVMIYIQWYSMNYHTIFQLYKKLYAPNLKDK